MGTLALYDAISGLHAVRVAAQDEATRNLDRPHATKTKASAHQRRGSQLGTWGSTVPAVAGIGPTDCG